MAPDNVHHHVRNDNLPRRGIGRQDLDSSVLRYVCSSVFLIAVLNTAAVNADDDVSTRYSERLIEATHHLFAKDVSYRVKPILDYIIQENKSWNCNRRDILDWGAGGGLLVSSLATNGATSVVAVNLDPEAVQGAKRRFQPISNAFSVQSMSLNEIPFSNHGDANDGGEFGQQELLSSFDIVVSYAGALGDFPDRDQRLCAATNACRNSGSVIIAQWSPLSAFQMWSFC